MIVCSELVTGYDDYGKVIFLQSNCARARRSGSCPDDAMCADKASMERQNETRSARFEAVVRSLLEPPTGGCGVYPPR